MRPRIGSLCSGYGGLDLGLMATVGGSLAWHAETERNAAAVLAHRFPDAPNLGDLTTVDWDTVEPVDWLTAGYPCQPFSYAGLRRGETDARNVWPGVARAVRRLRPRFVLLENVRGHLNLGFGRVLADLAALGYVGSWTCLRAADVGAPHKRERVFILATDADRLQEAPPADPVTMLPTPCASDNATRGWESLQRRAAGRQYLDLVTVFALLPTPCASWRRTSRQVILGGHPGLSLEQTFEAIEGVLPREADSWDQLPTAARLLPTPLASDGTKGGPNSRSSNGSPSLSAAVQPGRFGAYEAGVRRWEVITGRFAPEPIEERTPDRVRLAPRFVEWLMGLPDGHVTEVVTRRQSALHVLGNGVVPQQAAYAVALLLDVLTETFAIPADG